MKMLFYIFMLLSLSIQSVGANPIILFYFSELKIDVSGWKIELRLSAAVGPQSLDGWSLATSTDTAYFKNGMVLDTNYLTITQDDVTSPLVIHPDGDVLSLRAPFGVADQITFGDSGSMISAPRSGQSISLLEYRDEFQRHFYYLDNTPTLGGPNDSANARGTIRGIVTDSSGHPLDSARVIYDYQNWMGYQIDIFVITDRTGQFTIHDYARIEHLRFEKGGYETTMMSVQIWPDSEVNVSPMRLVVGMNEQHPLSYLSYALEQSYPNPFNPITTLRYRLPDRSTVRLTIHSINGQVVATLVNETEAAGYKSVIWNASSFASGIYFYRLEATGTADPRKKFTQVKKMLLIK